MLEEEGKTISPLSLSLCDPPPQAAANASARARTAEKQLQNLERKSEFQKREIENLKELVVVCFYVFPALATWLISLSNALWCPSRVRNKVSQHPSGTAHTNTRACAHTHALHTCTVVREARRDVEQSAGISKRTHPMTRTRSFVKRPETLGHSH